MSVIDEPTGELPVGSWVPWSAAADDPVTAEVPVATSPQRAQRPPMGPEPRPEHVAASRVPPPTDGFPRRGPFRALLVAAGAVTVVAVGITAMNIASGHQDPGTSPTVAAAPGTQATPGPELRSHSVLPPVLPPVDPASANAVTSASASAGSSPTVAGVVGPVPAVSVTVLNSTAVQGLGATEGDRLTADGWQVRRVTSVHLAVEQTTVYYDASQIDAARTLLARVPSVKVMKPRPLLLARTGGLIVVVAADAR